MGVFVLLQDGACVLIQFNTDSLGGFLLNEDDGVAVYVRPRELADI